MKEEDFQRQVIDLSHYLGYRVVHFRTSMNQRGQWMTAVQADGAGWVDLILAKPPRLILAELKAEKGTLSPEQIVWGEILSKCPGVEYYIWRPSQADEIEAILKGVL